MNTAEEEKAYEEGVQAFEERTAKRSECPYPDEVNEYGDWMLRIQWLSGYDYAQDEAAESWAQEQIHKNK